MRPTQGIYTDAPSSTTAGPKKARYLRAARIYLILISAERLWVSHLALAFPPSLLQQQSENTRESPDKLIRDSGLLLMEYRGKGSDGS
jgi:hypothetical protein